MILHIMIHSLQLKLALQSIIWKNSLYQCSLEDPGIYMKQKIWFEKDGRVVESHARPANIWSFDFWLVMASYQSWNYVFIVASSWCWNVQFLAIISHYIKNLKKITLVITVSEKNPGHLPPSLEGWVQQLASDDQSQFLVPHWRLP